MSCLFESIGYFLNIDHYQLRQQACDYLEGNYKIIDGVDTDVILKLEDPEYIKKMRNPNVWGGGNEIKAICNIYKIKIIVHILENNKKIEFVPINGLYRQIINIEWQGNHYEPKKI